MPAQRQEIEEAPYEEMWPVGNPADNPDSRRPGAPNTLFSGIKTDMDLRRPTYRADWTSALSVQNAPTFIGATLFLYFTCLAPVIAFGGAMQVATGGQLGIVETILSRGVCGMLYAAFAGQPMTIIGPTGLTLTFTSALYAFVAPRGIPFLPMYTWVGLWTSFFLIVASCTGAANLIRYCTRFTEDVFNAFLGTSYLHSATTALWSRLVAATAATAAGARNAASMSASALLTLVYGTLTFVACESSRAFSSSRYLSVRVRSLVADFGPALAVFAVSILSTSRFSALIADVPRLAVPAATSLGRPLLVPLFSLPLTYRLLAALPALFLACLFFLDQNITVRTVNSADNKLIRRATYHLDLLVLAVLTGLTSLCGLPWMCAATVESINHIRSLTSSSPPPAAPAAATAGATGDGTSPAVDANGNGGGAPSAAAPPISASIREAFAQADQDGSGKISPDEMVKLLKSMSAEMYSRPMSNEQAATMASEAFDKFNGLSSLGLEEFASWFTAAGLDDDPSTFTFEVSPGPLAPPPVDAAAPAKPVDTVLETRLSGFTIHALVLATLPFASSLRVVPIAVVNGVFLYLGKKVMTGNQFLLRVRALAVPLPANLRAGDPAERSILVLGRKVSAIFTFVQLACLATLWKLKLTPGLGMVFPAAIGVLMLIRVQVLPRLFTYRQMGVIDTPIWSIRADNLKAPLPAPAVAPVQ